MAIDALPELDRVLRVLVAGAILYVVVIATIRITGKRSTSRMNNFDWIVTVAVGSIFASGVVFESTSIAAAALAIIVLLCLQYVVTWAVRRWDWASRLVKSEPTVLVEKGAYCEDEMRRSRVTRSEVRAALRNNGIMDVSDACLVVLETDASISVITKEALSFDALDRDKI